MVLDDRLQACDLSKDLIVRMLFVKGTKDESRRSGCCRLGFLTETYIGLLDYQGTAKSDADLQVRRY